MEKYELCHWGIKGMKWGVRRFQNKDGSLTPAGKKRYDDDDVSGGEHDDHKRAHSKSVKNMSDQELRDKINRLNMERQVLDLERQISNLTPQEKASGESFIKSIGSKVVTPALLDAGKRVLTDFANKKGRELLGLDSKSQDPLDILRKTSEELKLKASIKRNQEILNGESVKPKKDADKPETVANGSKPDTSTKPDTKTESKVETVEAEIITPTKKASTSNSNAKSVHQLYEETYNQGRTTVDKLYSSGYSMTPISKLESNSGGTSGSNNKALLSTVGNWTMRSLEDMEKYN